MTVPYLRRLGVNPFARPRQPVVGRRGAVCTSQPLAAQAGLAVLRRGGNAVDAAVATAACLTVVEPTMNGLGGDAFALVWHEGRLHGLNGSGRAPAALDAAAVARAGHESAMPTEGWLPVTVPGAVAAWRDLHARFGALPFAEVLGEAVALAEDGYPVSPFVALAWRRSVERFLPLSDDPAIAPWFSTFAPDRRAPRAAETVRLPDHARTLRLLAASGGDALYHGVLAAEIDAFSAATGGLLTAADLAAHASTWVEPIAVAYRGHEVWELPPNGQGITALMALQLLEGFDLPAAGPAERAHLVVEAVKVAFADAAAHVADPEHVPVPTAGLLDPAYATRRRALIGERASVPPPGDPPRGATVYLCTADADGTMVSFIQSNYQGFGAGVVVPGTGIALQNRGAGFSLEPGHPNRVAPGKRPYHTIIPGFLTRDGEAVGPFGVMGGFMQPQGHVQLMVNTLDLGLHPQAALDAPRLRWDAGLAVAAEPAMPAAVVEGLLARGHQVSVPDLPGGFGHGQVIWRHGQSLVCGSETRADGQAAAW